MKFINKEDLDIPIDDAFAMLADYGFFERMALRRGVDVTRISDGEDGVGPTWDLNFVWSGRDINMKVENTLRVPPEELIFDAKAPAINANMRVELVPLSRRRTRLQLVTNAKAKTLPGRLILQSLKLARSNIERRISKRLSVQCRNLEERYRLAS